MKKLYVVLTVMLIAMLALSACRATDTPVPAPSFEPTAEVVPTEEPAGEPT